MNTVSATPLAPPRPQGRACFWAGLAACLIGLAVAVAQFSLKQLFVPWYAPALATLGALLLFVAVVRRPGIVRIAALLLVAGLAGLEWFFLVSFLKLPDYEGPAQAGRPFPAFSSTHADGQPFTDANLRDGSRHAMVFFRGRW